MSDVDIDVVRREDTPHLLEDDSSCHFHTVGLAPHKDVVRLDVVDLDHWLFIAKRKVPETFEVGAVRHELYMAWHCVLVGGQAG